MEIKDQMSSQLVHTMRIYNPHNYSFIFKKTEKIACAVFYIMNSGDLDVSDKGEVVSYIHQAAQAALEEVLVMLTGTDTNASVAATRELLRLQSALRLGAAAGLVAAEHVELLEREIDDVLRNIHTFTVSDGRANVLDFDAEKVYSQAVRNEKLRDQSVRVKGYSRERQTLGAGKAAGGASQSAPARVSESTTEHTDRRESIKAILRSKGQANIKDISDVISDCSEKTIQRELIAMIKDNQVVREGERRWSTYKLV